MPTNTSAAAATHINRASMPHTETATPSSTDALWWTATPDECDLVMGIRPWTADATYQPRVTFWQGDPTSLTAIASGSVYLGPEPTFFPVVPGVPVYVRVADNTTGTAAGTLTFTMDAGPQKPIKPGDLVIQDDSQYYPAVVRRREDGTVLRYIPVAAGEDGASAGDTMIASDSYGTKTYLYSRSGQSVKTEFDLGAAVNCLTQNRQSTYYLVVADDFYQVTNGVLSTMPYTLPYATINGIAVDEGLDRLYFMRSTDPNVVSRLTLSSGGGVTAFIAAPSGYTRISDIVRLHDGSIIVGHTNFSTTTVITRYSSDGVLLNSVTIADALNHICNDNHPLKFWVWLKVGGSSDYGRFILYDASLTAEIDWTQPGYGEGQFRPTGTATSPLFGHSISCTFWTVPPDCDVCGCECLCEPPAGSKLPPTGLSGIAKGDDPTRALAQWDAMCAYGGDVPTGTNGTDTENWAD